MNAPRAGGAVRTLRTAGPVVAVYFALLAFAHTAVLPGDVVLPMAGAAALTSIAAAVITTMAYRSTGFVRWAQAGITGILMLMMGNSLLHLMLVPDPVQTTNLMIVVIAAGIVGGSWATLLLILVTGTVGWSLVAFTHPNPGWTHFAFAWASSSLLSACVFAVRSNTLRRTLDALAEAKAARDSLQAAVVETQLSELRYRTVVDRCPDAVFAVSNGRIMYTNPAADVLLDLRSGTVVGERVDNLRPADEPHVLGDDVSELHLLDRNEVAVRVAIASTEVLLDERPLTIVFAREQNAQQSFRALQEAFLSTINHELRTPLTTVLGSVRLLERRHRTPENGELLDVAKRGVDRLHTQIEQLLDLRKSREIPQTPRETLGVDDLVRATLASLDHPDRARILAASDALVLGQEEPLIHALGHLIGNALKFDTSGDSVDIRTQRDGDHVRIHVCDRGPGIPLRFRSRIFDGFTQLHAGLARTHGGLGLGLTLARMVVTEHGGTMTLHDRDGGGSIVTITLPGVDPAG